MAGDHHLEVEEAPRREGRPRHVHGEVPAGAEDADLRMVQLLEDGPCRPSRRCRPRRRSSGPRRRSCSPHSVPGVDRAASPPNEEEWLAFTMVTATRPSRTVPPLLKPTWRCRAGFAQKLIRSKIPTTGIPSSFAISTDARRVVEWPWVTRMWVAPVDRLAPPRRVEHRVALEPGVDEQHLVLDLDAEAGVAEPSDLHFVLLRVARPTDRYREPALAPMPDRSADPAQGAWSQHGDRV